MVPDLSPLLLRDALGGVSDRLQAALEALSHLAPREELLETGQTR